MKIQNINKIISIIGLCFILCVHCLFSADKTYGNIRVSNITKIYDGDTITVNIKKYPPIIGEDIGVRIYGCDTPEIKSKTELEKQQAIKAKEFTSSLISQAKYIELRNIRRDKYFRILAEVWVYIPKEGWKNISEELIKNGLAKPYFGGTKEEW